MSALDLTDAAGCLVEEGALYVFLAPLGSDGPGRREFVVELEQGAVLVAEGFRTHEAAAGRSEALLGVPSTSGRVKLLSSAELDGYLLTEEGSSGAAAAVIALWTGAAGGPPPSGRVVPLQPGEVTVGSGNVAESAEAVLWVRGAGDASGAGGTNGRVQVPGGPLPGEGMLLAPRTRVWVDEGEATLEVRSLDQVSGDGTVRAALATLLSRSAGRAASEARARDARAGAAAGRRAQDDDRAERSGVTRLAEVVTGPPPSVAARTTVDPVLACASVVGAAGGFELSAELAAVEGRRGMEVIRALARGSGLPWRRVRLEGRWWEKAHDPLFAFRPDGSPVALVPTGGRYHQVSGDGREDAVTRDNARDIVRVAFAFSPRPPDEEGSGRRLARWVLAGSGRDISVLAVLGLVTGVVGLAVPLATGVVFDQIVPQGDTERLGWLMVALVLVAVALALLQLVQAGRQIRLEARAARRLGETVWERVINLPTSVVTRFGVGDLAGRVIGLDSAREVLGQAGAATVAATIGTLLVVVVLFVYDVTLAFIAVAAGILALALTMVLAVSVGRHAERFQEKTATVNGFVLEILRGLPKLRVAGGEARAFEQWAKRFAPAMGLDVARAQARLQLVIALLSPLGTLILFGAVAGLGGASVIGVGTFIAFQATYAQYLGSVGQMANTVGTAWQARPLVRRGAALLREPPETGSGLADPGVLNGAVELNDVVFRYQPDAAPVLDGLTLRAAPGEFLALVGPSGCGKSTVIRLLLGFEVPEAGSVLYDERELGSLDVAAVRRQLGVVLQDAQLTPGSIRQNIASGISLTDEEVWACADLAAIGDDVREMPMGLQTMVTPGAGAFSGGQKQRLLLARALARRPSVLILDEATSALDNVTQGVVADNVGGLGITRIVVAHRLSTIQSADRIVVLRDGRTVDQGTHDYLMAQGGTYASLVARQMV